MARYCEIKFEPLETFDRRSFRWKRGARGQRLLIGCPKGKYNASIGRCKVGTRVRAVLTPRVGSCNPPSRPITKTFRR